MDAYPHRGRLRSTHRLARCISSHRLVLAKMICCRSNHRAGDSTYCNIRIIDLSTFERSLRQSLRLTSSNTADSFAGRMAEVLMSELSKVAQLRSTHVDTKVDYKVALEFLIEATTAKSNNSSQPSPPNSTFSDTAARLDQSYTESPGYHALCTIIINFFIISWHLLVSDIRIVIS